MSGKGVSSRQWWVRWVARLDVVVAVRQRGRERRRSIANGDGGIEFAWTRCKPGGSSY